MKKIFCYGINIFSFKKTGLGWARLIIKKYIYIFCLNGTRNHSTVILDDKPLGGT